MIGTLTGLSSSPQRTDCRGDAAGLQDLLPGLLNQADSTLMETIEEKLPGVQAMEKKVGDEAAVVQVTADECAAMKKECE